MNPEEYALAGCGDEAATDEPYSGSRSEYEVTAYATDDSDAEAMVFAYPDCYADVHVGAVEGEEP